MIKIIAAVSGAGLIAGTMMPLPGMSLTTTDTSARTTVTSNVSAKGDRLDAHSFGQNCSQRGWPYFEASCIHRTDGGTAKPVRLVTTDRFPAE
jgi:hypothetical protein